ncbi:hypothetical protein [Actinomadura keratinilytica]|jgi:hypothetical protein|uniref:DUF3040 domain-containing protein n=1 Tax=Actinomadura keratinilytica TaxID=547461 RepID=A0ABP7YGG1_9ACTN
MHAEDDFGLWEQELRHDRADAAEDRGGRRGMLLVAIMTTLGCTAMIGLGQTPLGAAGLVVAGLILLLWRTGW